MKIKILTILFIIYFILITGFLDFFHTCRAGKTCCHHEENKCTYQTENNSVSINDNRCSAEGYPHEKQNYDASCYACYLSKTSNSPLNAIFYFVNCQSIVFCKSPVVVFYCPHTFPCFNIRAPPAHSCQV